MPHPSEIAWMERIAAKMRRVWPNETPAQIGRRAELLTEALAGLGPVRVFTLIEGLMEAELELRRRGYS